METTFCSVVNWVTSSSDDSVVLVCIFVVVSESLGVVDMVVPIVGGVFSSLDVVVVTSSTVVEGAIFDVVGRVFQFDQLCEVIAVSLIDVVTLSLSVVVNGPELVLVSGSLVCCSLVCCSEVIDVSVVVVVQL